MVTYRVTKIIPTCSPVIGQYSDTMIVASIDMSGNYDPSKSTSWKVLETVLSHLPILTFLLFWITCTTYDTWGARDLRVSSRNGSPTRSFARQAWRAPGPSALEAIYHEHRAEVKPSRKKLMAAISYNDSVFPAFLFVINKFGSFPLFQREWKAHYPSPLGKLRVTWSLFDATNLHKILLQLSILNAQFR